MPTVNQPLHWIGKLGAIVLLVGGCPLLDGAPSSAQPLTTGAIAQSAPTVPLPPAQPLKDYPSPTLKALITGYLPPGLVSSKTPSLIQLSIPSLWWIRDQLASTDQFGQKFVQEWVAYPRQNGQPGLVDLLVNRQQWSLLDYLQRYEFVNKFSTVARNHGYNTRVYDNADRLPIAFYFCDFSTVATQLQRDTPQPLTEAPDQVRGVPSLGDSLNCRLTMPTFQRRNRSSP